MILDNDAFERGKGKDRFAVCCDFCKAVLAPRTKNNILAGLKKSPFHRCMKGFCLGRLQIACGKAEPLSKTHPELAAEWHPTKNGTITPDMVTTGCGEKVWWLDAHGHEWPAPIYSRTNGKGCPHCVDQSKSIRERIERQIASGEKKSLKEEYPEISAQWHPTKNAHLKRANYIDRLTPDWILAGSHEKVWWLDKHGHEWEATVKSRINGSGCPKCIDRSKIKWETIERKIASGEKKSLKEEYPEIAAQWHPTKNAHLKRANDIDILTVDWITARSGEHIWWLCSEDPNHEWVTTVHNRTDGNGCPYCIDRSKKRRERNEREIASGDKKSLKEEYPEIAAEWHPAKNAHLKRANDIDPLTADWVTAGSNEYVWWLDAHGHEWEAMVADRTKGYGCPHCAEYGFNLQDEAIVYLMEQPDKMKIGITNLYTDVLENSRIKTHQRNGWELVDYIEFDVGQDAYDLEQKILAHLDANNIGRGRAVFLESFDGHTECWRVADYSPQSIAEIIAVLPTS